MNIIMYYVKINFLNKNKIMLKGYKVNLGKLF